MNRTHYLFAILCSLCALALPAHGTESIRIQDPASAPSPNVASAASSDAVAGSLSQAVTEMVYNGATLDRRRGNLSSTSLATLTAAGTQTGTAVADQTNHTSRGVKVIIDITAITGTGPTLTVTIQGKDAVSGKYFTVLTSAALSTAATTVLTVYPGLTASANTVANDVLPRDWRIIYSVAGTTPAVTATISAALLP